MQLFSRILVTILLVFSSPYIWSADIKGSSDYPDAGRFKGSEIVGYSQSTYDEYIFPEGDPVSKDGAWKLKKSTTIEGKITRILYKTPKGKSTLEVFKNYEKKLKNNGFKEVYYCKQKGSEGCGYTFLHYIQNFQPPLIEYAYQYANDIRYYTFKKQDPKGDVYVSLMVYRYSWDYYPDRFGRAWVQMDVIEVAALNDDQIEVITAENITNQVNEKGRIALYGIYFDTNKSTLKKESNAILDQIQKALVNTPSLKVYVVGHTDNTGSFKRNVTLSRERASAVVSALIKRGISSERLQAHGVASLAPVSTNNTEAGRTKNRRVELVAQ